MAIINNVSTGMAMYVGERILQGVMLEDIVREIGDDLAVEHQLYYPQTDKPRAILPPARPVWARRRICRRC
jgi:sigma-54 dependent transcriptional regulator of gfr operon